MKSKLQSLIASAVFVLVLCGLVSSCSSSTGKHDEESIALGTETASKYCKHSFGAYEYPEGSDCRSECVMIATCKECGEKSFGSKVRGQHIFADNELCVYCGVRDMKNGVEYRDGDFIYIRRGESGCEAILADDVVTETVNFPSSYGGYDVTIIRMANSESARKAVKHISIPAGVEMTSVYAFKDCSALETVRIAKGCKLSAIGYEAFAGCGELRSVELENCSSLAEIGARAFASCSSLEQIILPSTVNKVEERAFTGCFSLRKVSFESEYLSLGVGVFLDCTSLSNVNFLNKVETIPGSTFSGCTGLERIRIPDNVKYIEDYAFEKSGLVEVALSHSLISLGNMAFFECESLERVDIYDGVKIINTSTFAGCKALKKVVLPSTLEEIYPSAFADCVMLERIVIPESVKSLAANAFYRDSSLSEVIFERTEGWVKGNEAIDAQMLADPTLAARLLREGVTSELFLIP
jgi:hypothetical protein